MGRPPWTGHRSTAAVTMLDLNRESVEYVCTKFRSPHIARRFGHKMYGDYQDPYVEALRIRALSVEPSVVPLDVPAAPVRPAQRGGGDYDRYISTLSHSTRDQDNRDLTRKTKSWRSAPPSNIRISSTDNAKFKLNEIPKIFIYHGSTLKNYFKNWK